MIKMWVSWSVILLLLLQQYSNGAATSESVKPNIVIIIIDDLGFNDVSYHGSQQIPTPNIDQLAYDSTVLTRHYVQPICTPSRAALLTGMYPIRLGLQHDTVEAPQPYGLPLNVTTMAQRFKRNGYKTHVVGKWHLGFFEKPYTPTMRGFDTFLGFYGGSENYWDHTVAEEYFGVDFHEDVGGDLKPAWNYFGNYSTDLFGDRACKIIDEHDAEQPLLLYLPFQGVHAPLQGKTEDLRYFPHTWDIGRRNYATQVKAVDDNIGKVVSSLKEHDMWENTIILVSSDNGGPHFPPSGFEASNYPLRSTKTYLFEGGVRVPAFVRGPGIPNHVNFDGYVHITDWLPTFYTAAGGNVSDLGFIDGIDQWEALKSSGMSDRQEILLNIDPVMGESGIISGRYKLLVSTNGLHKVGSLVYDQWYHDSGPFNESDTKRVSYKGSWKLPVVVCNGANAGKYKEENSRVVCDLKKANSSCLFDVISDPCEYNNIISDYPEIAAKLKSRLQEFEKQSVTPANKPNDPNCDPAANGGAWMPWR